ncbi:MAG: hypothetical protein AMJ42_03760, partial [Deltaproteobacteria bacterium DG_8]
MKIYALEEISNSFNQLVSAIDDGCREHQFLVAKAGALSLAITIYKEQLSRGMILVENSENVISALNKVEQSINFKINACTTEEI